MFEFNELKETLLKKAVDVADATKELAKKATDKTKTVAKITRLTAEIAGEKDTIKKHYAEIGKLYYEKYRDSADEDFEQLITEIIAAEETIAAKQAEIEELKNSDDIDDDVEVEIYEEIENFEEKAEEVVDAAEEKAEDIAETIEDKAEAVEEVVEEVKDKIN